MNATIYKTVLVAGGLAMATAVIAQMQMRTGPTAAPIGQLQMAAPTAADFAQLKAKLNADQALIASMNAKIDKLERRFATHTHLLRSDGKTAMFVPVVPCKDIGTPFGGSTATCEKSFWPSGGSGLVSIAPYHNNGTITLMPTVTDVPK